MKDLLEQQELLSGRMPVALKWLYLILIAIALIGLGATWFIYMDVVVNAKGILRPLRERTSVRASAGGLIDSIWVKEGQFVREGDRLAVLKDDQQPVIEQHFKEEISRKKALLRDLNLLISLPSGPMLSPGSLVTTLYKEQYAQFVHQLNELKIMQAQTKNEFDAARKLIMERIISPAEFDFRKSAYLQRSASLKNSYHQQLANWNREKQGVADALDQLQQRFISLSADKEKRQLIAPVSGHVIGLLAHYTGSLLQAGEVFCAISPEDSLIAECYVDAANIGFLRAGQKVVLKVDAYDHRQFGVVHGTVHSIDNDFTNVQESPVFKIRCSVRERSVSLKNGYSASLKKGMTLQARFMITRRTLWQLFFDRLHNWFEPVVTA